MTTLYVPHNLITTITNIGDTALLGALVLTGSVYFLIRRCPREAAALSASFFLTAALIAMLKIAFMTCGHSMFGIRSPSGHTALSVAVFGTIAMLLVWGSHRWTRFLLPVLLIILAAFIAVSRVTLGFHSTNEVVVGVLVGVASIAAIGAFILRPAANLTHESRGRFNVPALIVLMVLAACLSYGVKLPAEKMITEFAAQLKKHSKVCVD